MLRIVTSFAFCILLTLVGCDKLPSNDVASTKFKLVNTNALYQVALPDFLTKATNLSEDASLQYQNVIKGLYVVVIHESLLNFKQSFEYSDLYNDSLSVIDNYTDVQFQTISESMQITSDVLRKSARINGLPARIIEFDAIIDDVPFPITYYYTFYAGKDNIYLMLTWTAKSKREKYQPLLEKIAKSFRLISQLK